MTIKNEKIKVKSIKNLNKIIRNKEPLRNNAKWL